MSDISSSPNLHDKDDDDDDPSADVDEEDDEQDDDNDDPSPDVDKTDESLDEVTIEAIVEKKGRSIFWWSQNADCIVNNATPKDETLIHILLAKEPWKAGHGKVMKA